MWHSSLAGDIKGLLASSSLVPIIYHRYAVFSKSLIRAPRGYGVVFSKSVQGPAVCAVAARAFPKA